MRIVLAPDAFKSCLPAEAVCRALRRGIQRACPSAEVLSFPLADGGEGTLDCFLALTDGRRISVRVHDAYFQPKTAAYCLSADGKTAYIEMAAAAGIQGIDKNYLQTERATTYGVGELMADAIRRGAKTLILGLGGSATTDGGMGALAALGVQFLDACGTPLSPVGANMAQVAALQVPDSSVFRGAVQVICACDVENPFYGDAGAAFVFAPQKGADAETVVALDAGLRSLARCYAAAFSRNLDGKTGLGAAGGLCGGLYAAFGGAVQSGFETLAALAKLDAALPDADLVVTGEGRTDAQTACGKLPWRVAQHAAAYGVPCLLLSGAVDAEFLPYADRFVQAIALQQAGTSAAYAIEHADALLCEAIYTYLKGADFNG